MFFDVKKAGNRLPTKAAEVAHSSACRRYTHISARSFAAPAPALAPARLLLASTRKSDSPDTEVSELCTKDMPVPSISMTPGRRNSVACPEARERSFAPEVVAGDVEQSNVSSQGSGPGPRRRCPLPAQVPHLVLKVSASLARRRRIVTVVAVHATIASTTHPIAVPTNTEPFIPPWPSLAAGIHVTWSGSSVPTSTHPSAATALSCVHRGPPITSNIFTTATESPTAPLMLHGSLTEIWPGRAKPRGPRSTVGPHAWPGSRDLFAMMKTAAVRAGSTLRPAALVHAPAGTRTWTGKAS